MSKLDHPIQKKGYSIGNFGISADITGIHSLISQVQYNPPQIGEPLIPLGLGILNFTTPDISNAKPNKFAKINEIKTFPEYEAVFQNNKNLVSINVRAFCPLEIHSSNISFFPCIIYQIEVNNNSDFEQQVHWDYIFKSKFGSRKVKKLVLEDHLSLISGSLFISSDGGGKGTPLKNRIKIGLGGKLCLSAGQKSSFTIIMGNYSNNGFYTSQIQNIISFINFIWKHENLIEKNFDRFLEVIPKTGLSDLDSYLRWYMSAGIILTKGFGSGEVITMGYLELNQRDSYWSSWVHLVFWPELERIMILESCAAQHSNGKIPTCILPTIERWDDLDINAYFILRIFRYVDWYQDNDLLSFCWPYIKSAIQYLVEMDNENIGLPLQKSYWADWKDVPGVIGRKYAPHFCLLWLAVLKKTSEAAKQIGDNKYASQLSDKFEVTYRRINEDFTNGGLWNKNRYSDQWIDGRIPEYTLEDQVVGPFFNVVPEDRIRKIFDSLKNNENEFGVKETYPYIQNFNQDEIIKPGYRESDYHNGGIWPYLNSIDITSRFIHGYPEDAERIMHKVGFHDLVAPKDFSPNEFLNGETGENKGPSIQGWCAAYFAAIYIGMYGLKRSDHNTWQLTINHAAERPFSTKLLIPEGIIEITRSNQAFILETTFNCLVNLEFRWINFKTGTTNLGNTNLSTEKLVCPGGKFSKEIKIT